MVIAAADVPDEMRGVHERFTRWRESHTGQLPIPKSLWIASESRPRPPWPDLAHDLGHLRAGAVGRPRAAVMRNHSAQTPWRRPHHRLRPKFAKKGGWQTGKPGIRCARG